ncbi:MAG: PRC-barrel domain-containing protein [Luteolibacter sp.]
MLRNINDIYGTQLAATDGTIGHVKDFYFDDGNWMVRYLIVDTGSWLTGRQVLLSPHAFDGFGPDGEVLRVNLTREQIENSPSIESHRPVTRQHERDYYQYYSWPAYWETSGMWGIGGLPVLTPPVEIKAEVDPLDDIHLRSTRAVTGYGIKAAGGTLGTVSGFMVDHKSWAIADLVVETGHWYSGKQILISPAAVLGISYGGSEVSVKLTRADIKRTREDEAAKLAFVSL